MDIIIEKAKRVIKNNYQDLRNYDQILNLVKEILSDIDSKLDKIKFLNYLLESNNKLLEEHNVSCEEPETCAQNYGFENITYYLSQELNRLGVGIDFDVVTTEEKNAMEVKLNQILKDFEELKLGHQIIYEDLLKELNELKDLYYLGKKKWYQLLIGKSFEMVAKSIISETIFKQLLEDIKKAIPDRLN